MKNLPFKVLRIVLFLSLCITLPACDPNNSRLDYDALSESVVSVELIHYENPEQKHFSSWVPDQSSELQPYDFAKESVKRILDETRISEFLTQLSEATILDKYYAFDSPNGVCLKLTYDNGDFLIIYCDSINESYSGYVGEFYADGKVKRFIGSFSDYNDFESLVNDFFHFNLS